MICTNCGNETTNEKYCSIKCKNLSRVGYKHSDETKKLIRQNRKGKCFGNKRSESFIKKISGKNNYAWKGKNASYFAIHAKISRQKGKAKKCEDCGTEKGKIEWTNIDHKYSRNPDDYIARCVKCHRIYDIKNNNYRVFSRTLVE